VINVFLFFLSIPLSKKDNKMQNKKWSLVSRASDVLVYKKREERKGRGGEASWKQRRRKKGLLSLFFFFF
jgi:predicted secreted protein